MNSNANSQPIDAQSTVSLLRSERRRHAILALAERDSPASLTGLATAVGARETGREPERVPMGLAKTIQVSLHHIHLPRLADGGVVEYDPDEHTVVPRRVEDVVPAVRALEEATGR